MGQVTFPPGIKRARSFYALLLMPASGLVCQLLAHGPCEGCLPKTFARLIVSVLFRELARFRRFQ